MGAGSRRGRDTAGTHPLVIRVNDTDTAALAATAEKEPSIPSWLHAPNGKRIVASSDLVPGNAFIASATRNPDGTFEIEWEGETKMCWDGQYTETHRGQRVFIDEDGNQWLEKKLALAS